MSVWSRVIVLSLAVLAATAAGSPAADPAGGGEAAFRGACYCKAGPTLQCTANVTERECRRQCDEARDAERASADRGLHSASTYAWWAPRWMGRSAHFRAMWRRRCGTASNPTAMLG